MLFLHRIWQRLFLFNMRHVVLCLILCSIFSVNAQKYDSTFSEKVQNTRDKALLFLVESQIDSSIANKQFKGEWYGTMELTEPYFFIGKKQNHKDSNGFTVSAIHNFLAEVYLADTTLTYLKPTLNKAFQDILTYRNGQKFNFWKALPPNRKLKLFGEPNPQPLVHRPTEYRLRSRFINNAANVPEDADDTSLGNLATMYHNEIFADTLPLIVSEEYDKFLDLKRKNRNWYNHLFVRYPNSGAFLTWHSQEFRFWFLKTPLTFLSTLFIFMPGSSARPKAYKPWIPFGANDVDVVVNSNVLTYLAVSNQLDKSLGKKGAIAYTEFLLKQPRWYNNAVYYPNLYHIHYGVARAYAAGVEQLAPVCQTILENIIETQNQDGSFESQDWLNKKDLVQSTAYALHAMLDMKSKGMTIENERIERAIKFLIEKSLSENNGIKWEGGIFFSGGTALRNILVWKSDAYTTALIANSLTKYLKITQK